MSDQLSDRELTELAKELNITNPILAHRVVGNRVEIHCLGDLEYTVYDMSKPEISGVVDIPSLLSDLTLKELRLIAKDLDVTGYSKMTKAALVKALSGLNSKLVADTLVKLNF